MTEVLATPPRPSGERRTAWRRLLVGLSVFALAAAGLIALARHAPHEPRQPFDEDLAHRVEEQSPDFVVLGNSMVQTRFDEGELNRLLRPARVSLLGFGGSKSAFWYLTLKNVVLPAAKPKRVLLFFRLHELTNPREKATGIFAYGLSRVRHKHEPLVDAKLAPPLAEPIERLGYELEQLAPFSRLHALAHPYVETWARELTGTLRRDDRRRQQHALDDIFATDKLRNANIEPASAAVERGSFDEVVGPSFLPDIIELMKRERVPLTLVRVRTRAAADGRRTPTAYDRDLDAYLAKRHVELVDMTNEKWERAELYGEGDHIAPRFRHIYTRLFVKNLRRVFQ